MKRHEALQVIDAIVGSDPLVVTCGATSRELAHIGRRPSHLYLLDSMGLSACVSLGVSYATDKNCWAIEGDGSLLMGLTVVPTLASAQRRNMKLILLDNGQHASADLMPTQAAQLDLGVLIKSTGIPVWSATNNEDLRAALVRQRENAGTCATHVRIEGGNRSDTPWLHADPVNLATDFAQVVQNGDLPS